MATSAMVSAAVQGGMKKMVMFRHLDTNTKMIHQKIESLGFINPFNLKSYHFEKDTVSTAEVKLQMYFLLLCFLNAGTIEYCNWSGHFKKGTEYKLVQ